MGVWRDQVLRTIDRPRTTEGEGNWNCGSRTDEYTRLLCRQCVWLDRQSQESVWYESFRPPLLRCTYDGLERLIERCPRDQSVAQPKNCLSPFCLHASQVLQAAAGGHRRYQHVLETCSALHAQECRLNWMGQGSSRFRRCPM